METFVEYMAYVKGMGYILVVAFLIAFVTFWIIVNTKNKEILKNLPIVIVIWLVFGGISLIISDINDAKNDVVIENTPPIFPGYYSNGSPATITTHRAEIWMNINSSDYSSMSYGTTDFHEIMDKKLLCIECHHNSNEVRPCVSCHGIPFNPEEISKLGLKAAIHQRCQGCHKEIFTPDGCKLCHTQKIQSLILPPEMPHTLTWNQCTRCHTDGLSKEQKTNIVYHDFCIVCHTMNSGNAKNIDNLPSHLGRTSDTCRGCHKLPVEK